MKRGVAISGLVVLALALALAAFLLIRGAESRPTVTARWAIYVEHLEPSQKLVALTSEQRYAASKEFTARLLAIARIQATIELTAWADVSYFVDLSNASAWSVAWDRKSKILLLSAPEPDCLLPAVKTETIEIKSKGANLVTNIVFRLKAEAEKMRSELSADLLQAARASLSEEAVRKGVRAGLEGFARSFCASVLRVAPSAVVVRLAGD
jgi:hypothetical protein